MIDYNYQTKIGNEELKIKVNAVAEQANSSLFLQYGETSLMVTATMSDKNSDRGYFPLMVNYEEKYYAAGEILGSRYVRREGRPSDEATLNARLIDRTIRPLFPEGLKREVQVVITVLSWDGHNPAILGLMGASIALSISDIPWEGPLTALDIGYLSQKEKWMVNPNEDDVEKDDFILTLSAVNKGKLINMMEASGKEVSEKKVLEGIKAAQPTFKKLNSFQKKIIKKHSSKKIDFAVPEEKNADLIKDVQNFVQKKASSLYGKQGLEMKKEFASLKKELASLVEEKYSEEERAGYFDIFDKEIKKMVRKEILDNEKRLDGRKLDEVRPLRCQTSLFPRIHGSGLFKRGLTKVMSIVTLGVPDDQKLVEGMSIDMKKHYMHHYNFPPYSVGEVSPFRSPGRREIGHGRLAEKAVRPVLPSFDDFPYTVRIVSEILSSNGSTSMGAVSGSSLSLMDAGVPIKKHVAGIAMGLVKEDDKKYKILTDIQGQEDFNGDMDFKVAGTTDGINAIQLDVKTRGLDLELIEKVLKERKKLAVTLSKRWTPLFPNHRQSSLLTRQKLKSLKLIPIKLATLLVPVEKQLKV